MNQISSTPTIRNPVRLLHRIINGIIHGRRLALRLFIRDIKSEFKTTALGHIWNFMDPIVYSIIFMILSYGEIIHNDAIDIPYPVYVVFGMMFFQTFSQALLYPFGIFQRSKPLLQEVNIPIESLWMSLLLRQAFDASFRIIVMLVLAGFFGLLSVKGLLFFFISFPVTILSGVSIGLFFAPMNGIYDDFEKLAHILMRPLMFVSPTFFKSYGSVPIIDTFNKYNPLAICMDNARTGMAMGHFSDLNQFIYLTVFSLILFCIAVIFFTVTINTVAENL